MPDWLTHVLVIYILLKPIDMWSKYLRPADVSIGMVGGLIPDLAKVELAISSDVVETLLGLPFSWFGIAWFWGVLLTAGLLSLLIASQYRLRAYGLLILGGAIHILLDSMIITPGPTSSTPLKPITYFITPELYLSSNIWASVLAAIGALVIFTLSRRIRSHKLR